MYLLSEKLTSTVATYMILKRVMKPWTSWEAYKNGIIDKHGKRLRRPRSAKEREGWDILDRFCWSIKRLCTKYLGDSTFAYIFSAAYLMKEDAAYVVSKNMDKYIIELEDFNTTKQKHLFDCFHELEQNKLICESRLDLETNILKILAKATPIIEKYMIEDDAGAGMGAGTGTALGDIAQFTPVLGSPNKKRIQRRLTHGNYRRNRRKQTGL
jgi:hypothetical protein